MEKEIITIIGLIGTIIGIIKAINEILKTKISLITIIIILIGVIILLVGFMIKPKCDNPFIKITSPTNEAYISNEVEVRGNVKCCPSEYQVALIIHRRSTTKTLEKWFIHPECAAINTNFEWHLSNVNVGTINVKGENYELFAYLVPDSTCRRIHQVVDDPIYQGTFSKPTQINGVYDKIQVKL